MSFVESLHDPSFLMAVFAAIAVAAAVVTVALPLLDRDRREGRQQEIRVVQGFDEGRHGQKSKLIILRMISTPQPIHSADPASIM